MDLSAWLRGLGLGQYEQAFRDNAIDEQVRRNLTAEDLKEIGVATVGDRRRLLAAIAELAVALGEASLAAQCGRAAQNPEASAERRPLTS